jgi:hypothetical protein
MRADVPGAERTDFDFSFEGRVDGNALAGGRGMTADEHRSLMESHAERLKPLVSGVRGPATCESKRVLINTLESGDLRYVFLVNDERTYGPRFGSWKLEFETGLRQEARVRLGLAAGGEPALYDAIEKTPIVARFKDGVAEFEVMLPAARGKLVAVLPERVGRVEIATPRGCERGQPYPISVRVLGASGKPIRGALPVRVEITDPLGRPNEYSRYASADTDPWVLTFRPAANDPSGSWKVRVTELVGGTRAEQSFELP